MTREYEVLVIFPPTAREEAIEKLVDRVKQDIERTNGRIAETKMIGLKNFARPLRCVDKGYYVQFIVDMESSQVDALKSKFRLNEDMYRFMITRKEESAAKQPAAG